MAVRSVIIEGLFGRKTAEVQLIDNRVILIGNNGIGKTTIINCIFAFLARRWDRLFANPISAIRIEFNDGTNLYVTRNDFERHNELSQFSPNSLTIKAPSMLKRRSLQWSTLATWLSERNDPTIMRQLASRFDTSEVVFRNWLDSVDVAVESESALYRVEKYLHNKNFSVMFFPTYRKVEKDLKAILTTRDEYKFKKMEDGLSELFAKPDLPAGCNEFIEFGMEEVVIQIEKRCQELKATVINEFSNLARNYIKEMIQSAQLRGYSEVIKYVDWIIIDRMMERLQNADFSAAEVENIKSMVTEIKSTNRAPGGKPKKEAYTALFLSKLLELEQAVAPLDQRIRSFVETANYYLNSKKLAFNSKDSSITLLLSESNDPLDFSQLSSGEKQIVSTFSHLILHPSECKIVLIDEPELSLSVVWQERLLSDILKYSNCLIAATHSPFIIKRPEVKKYAIDLYPVIMEQAITK